MPDFFCASSDIAIHSAKQHNKMSENELNTIYRKNLNRSCDFTKHLLIHKTKITELSTILDLNLSNEEKVKSI